MFSWICVCGGRRLGVYYRAAAHVRTPEASAVMICCLWMSACIRYGGGSLLSRGAKCVVASGVSACLCLQAPPQSALLNTMQSFS
jgi:hypothetical protein